MKKILLISVLFLAGHAFAQTTPQASDSAITNRNGNSIYRFTDVPPQPLNGISEFLKFVSDNIAYPQAAIDSGISGRVAYQFVVEKDGRLSHLSMIKDIGGGCGEAVEKAIEGYHRAWVPAKVNGQPVRSYFTGTFNFKMKEAIPAKYSRVVLNPDKSPMPSGSIDSFEQYLARNIHYPLEAMAAGIGGKVVYQFVIDTTGTISNIKILSGIGYGCDDTVKKVLENCPFHWTPADSSGHLVASCFTGTFNFSVDNGKRRNKGKIYSFTDEQAIPPGGQEAFQRYLAENTKYPEEAAKAGVSGRVAYRFIVDTNGKISNVTILRGLGFGCSDAVKDALEKYHTHWIPAKQNGHPVKSYYTGTFNFSLR